MTDYTELVEALRVCASAGECKPCERDLYCEPTKMLSDAAAAIEALQAQLSKRGEWIRIDKHTVQCPLCHRYLDLHGVNAGRGDANYCPNCGANMEVQDEAD